MSIFYLFVPENATGKLYYDLFCNGTLFVSNDANFEDTDEASQQKTIYIDFERASHPLDRYTIRFRSEMVSPDSLPLQLKCEPSSHWLAKCPQLGNDVFPVVDFSSNRHVNTDLTAACLSTGLLLVFLLWMLSFVLDHLNLPDKTDAVFMSLVFSILNFMILETFTGNLFTISPWFVFVNIVFGFLLLYALQLLIPLPFSVTVQTGCIYQNENDIPETGYLSFQKYRF